MSAHWGIVHSLTISLPFRSPPPTQRTTAEVTLQCIHTKKTIKQKMAGDVLEIKPRGRRSPVGRCWLRPPTPPTFPIPLQTLSPANSRDKCLFSGFRRNEELENRCVRHCVCVCVPCMIACRCAAVRGRRGSCASPPQSASPHRRPRVTVLLLLPQRCTPLIQHGDADNRERRKPATPPTATRPTQQNIFW